ncbi:hypothetical protein [uncultured Pluralibacter sp.]|uniref:hypothetical protein n=1 Tax=uncultured Pluralibacter sp. TaxID=1490864 RepID=UPI002623B031|nr:hypothetical protein [uncultured Pluralibacter sp.]
MLTPYLARVLTWFVLSAVICLCVWGIRRKILKDDCVTLATARERFIREGANATFPFKPTLPDNPSDSLMEAYYVYEHWKEKARKTGTTGLNIIFHIPGLVAIVLLLSL